MRNKNFRKTAFCACMVALLMPATANSQNTLSLEDAVNNWKTIPVKRPHATQWNTSQGTYMPYEAASSANNASFYETSEDGVYGLIYYDTRKVWRYETRGNFDLMHIQTGKARKLGKGLPESSLMFAKLSPDGKKVAYVSRNNIYLEYTDSDDKRKMLTTDGNDSIVNGTFDWVYEEEFDCRDGFRWSGDSRYVAYWHSNTSGTGWFDIINNVDSVYPTIQHFPYPKAGTTNSAVSIRIVDVVTGKTTDIAIPGNPRENYLPRMEFVPGTNRLMIQQMNRAQNTNTVWTCNIVNGNATDLKVLCTDTDKAWVETNDDIHWLPGNRFFTFTSERDGWRHIYRVSADGKKWTCITNAEMDVISEEAYDEKRGYLYFTGTPADRATERYLYRCKVMGNGKVEKISGDMVGQYSYNISPNCDYAVEMFSSANSAPVYKMLRCDKGGKWSVESTLEDNAGTNERFRELGLSRKEFVKVKSGELELDAWIIKPKDFDPSKKYPVIDYVYGEPAAATVQNRWESTLFWQYLAQQGFVVVSIENRGTDSPRGREWRKCIYGEVGVAASEDQAQGIMDMCRRFEWMDSTRIGITGWSGGGSQTLNSMFRYPEVFKTGVAIAFVSDQRLYDTIYQERYMNTPQNNPDGYFRASPINFVEGLKGNLLLIHGTGDDNVHYQNCELLANELIRNGKLFYQVSYPMRTHSINEGKGTSLHLRKTIVDFFKNNL